MLIREGDDIPDHYSPDATVDQVRAFHNFVYRSNFYGCLLNRFAVISFDGETFTCEYADTREYQNAADRGRVPVGSWTFEGVTYRVKARKQRANHA